MQTGHPSIGASRVATPQSVQTEVQAHIVNAFIDGAQGGNPAGVVVDADGLSFVQKLQVARQLGLSETAFVSRSQHATVKLEFFTPTRQIPHCGHATIATFALLRQLGRLGDGAFSKETIDGDRDINIDGEVVLMEQRAPSYRILSTASELADRIAASLGLSAAQLAGVISPAVVSTGNAFLLIGLADAAAVAAVQPDFALLESISEELDVIGYYVYSGGANGVDRHAGVRMFAPRFGIREESATGTAAGPLACYLRDYAGVDADEIVIEQGYLMQPPSPSVIKVRLAIEDGRIVRLMVGGTARLMRTETLSV